MRTQGACPGHFIGERRGLDVCVNSFQTEGKNTNKSDASLAERRPFERTRAVLGYWFYFFLVSQLYQNNTIRSTVIPFVLPLTDGDGVDTIAPVMLCFSVTHCCCSHAT